jgi:plasmid stabilization system protein ParE
MDYQVIFKDTFRADLEHIVRWVAVHNPDAARRLGERIIRIGESLSFFPERHPRVRQRPGVRRFIAARHFKVFYRVQTESRTVEILRCWDGRRGIGPAL